MKSNSSKSWVKKSNRGKRTLAHARACLPRSTLPIRRREGDVLFSSYRLYMIHDTSGRRRLGILSIQYIFFLVIDEVEYLLQIFPGLTLRILIVGPQQIGRMVRHHHRYVTPFKPVAAHSGNPFLACEQRLGG